MKKDMLVNRSWLFFCTGYIVFAVASLSAIPVIERWVSALWQMYKFSGYETTGVITLSKSSSVLYSVFLLMIFLVASLGGYLSMSESRLKSIFFWSQIISMATFVLFFVLAFSPLNVWR